MRLLLVNPNTSASMTAHIGAAASAAAAPRTEVRAVNPTSGPASIEGYFDEAFAAPGLLEEIVKGEAEGFDAFVIACFDDTGAGGGALRDGGPVIGIGEAAFHVASLIAHRLQRRDHAVALDRADRGQSDKYGLDRRCARVRACEVPVLALDDPTSGACERLSAEIERAKAEEGAEAIVLGCAGMAELAASSRADIRLACHRRRRGGGEARRGAGRSGARDLEAGALRPAAAEDVCGNVRGLVLRLGRSASRCTRPLPLPA